MDVYPLISVVILNWNRLQETKCAIESVLNQSYPNIEILVLDNASTEPNSDSIAKIFPKVNFHQLDKNYGCPGGRNLGIELCTGDFIFFVDNDGILEKNAILNAYNIFNTQENIGIVGGKVQFFKSSSEIVENPQIQGKHFYASTFSGGVSMHKKSIYDAIGLFNSDYMYGHEETNLSLRLLTINKYVYYSDNIILWHKQSSISRNNSFNLISKYNNKLLTYWELLPTNRLFFFTIWYLLIYPIRCFKSKCLLLFIKNISPSLRKAYVIRKESKIRLTNKDFNLFKKLENSQLLEITQ